jgi:hypothetical protein
MPFNFFSSKNNNLSVLLCFRVKSNRVNATAPAPNAVVMVMVMRGMKTPCQREKGEG